MDITESIIQVTDVDNKIDPDQDFEASSNRLTELLAGRKASDIPFNDEYWKALIKHRIAHGSKK